MVLSLPVLSISYLKKHKEGGTYLGSQFEGTVNHGGEIMMTGIQKGT